MAENNIVSELVELTDDDITCLTPTQCMLIDLADKLQITSKLDNHNANMVSSAMRASPSAILDNCIHDSVAMPSKEGDTDMYHRQKLTINGVSQWRSFSSIQDLVDLVTAQVQVAMKNKSSDVLFIDYMYNWYHQFKERTLCVDYRESYESIMKTHILPVVGNKRISDISVNDVQAILDTTTSASYAKQTKSIINQVMQAAIADEIYTHPNPTKDPRLVMPTTVKKREAVPKDDLSAVIALLPHMPAELARILAILIMTGCRRGEALGACWQDIDWDANTIHLQRVVRFHNNRPVVSEKMKTKAANRTVAIWPEFIPYLGDRKESGYLINDNGQPLSETMWRHRWNNIIKYLKEAGIEQRFTPHQLRHSYATMAANSGKIAPKVLQGMLGHANFQTTMNIYAGFDNEKVRESSHDLSAEYSKLAKKSCREVVDIESPKSSTPSAF